MSRVQLLWNCFRCWFIQGQNAFQWLNSMVWHVLLAFTSAPNASWLLLLICFSTRLRIENVQCERKLYQQRVHSPGYYLTSYEWNMLLRVPLIIYLDLCVCEHVCVSVFLYQMCIRQLFRTPNKSQKRAWSAYSDMMKNYKMGEKRCCAECSRIIIHQTSPIINNGTNDDNNTNNQSCAIHVLRSILSWCTISAISLSTAQDKTFRPVFFHFVHLDVLWSWLFVAIPNNLFL